MYTDEELQKQIHQLRLETQELRQFAIQLLLCLGLPQDIINAHWATLTAHAPVFTDENAKD